MCQWLRLLSLIFFIQIFALFYTPLEAAKDGTLSSLSMGISLISLEKAPKVVVNPDEKGNVGVVQDEGNARFCIYSNMGQYRLAIQGKDHLSFDKLRGSPNQIRYKLGLEVIEKDAVIESALVKRGIYLERQQAQAFSHDFYQEKVCKQGWNARLLFHVNEQDIKKAPSGIYFDALTVVVSLN